MPHSDPPNAFRSTRAECWAQPPTRSGRSSIALQTVASAPPAGCPLQTSRARLNASLSCGPGWR
eukprot:1209452-Alexandrium_andersonii.AAC.1